MLDEITGYVPEPWQNLISETEWSEAESNKVKEDMTKIIIEVVQCSDSQKKDLLGKIYDSEKCEFLIQALTVRKLNIAKALMKQHNATVKPVLHDFDWKAKWILGNSSSTVMKYPLVNLQLNTLYHKGNKSENITVELTKSELDALIETLEESYNRAIV